MTCKFKDGDVVRISPNVMDVGWRLFKVVNHLTPAEAKKLDEKINGEWDLAAMTFSVDSEDLQWIDTSLSCTVVRESRDDKTLCVNPLFAGKLGIVVSEGLWNSEPPVPWYHLVIDGWGVGVSEPNLELVETDGKLGPFLKDRRPLFEL